MRVELLQDKLRRLRRSKKLTQEELSFLSRVHISQISNYELGATYPSPQVLIRLSVTLGVSMDDLTNDLRQDYLQRISNAH